MAFSLNCSAGSLCYGPKPFPDHLQTCIQFLLVTAQAYYYIHLKAYLSIASLVVEKHRYKMILDKGLAVLRFCRFTTSLVC